MKVPLLNFVGGPGVPLLNFRGVLCPTFKLWGGEGGGLRYQGPKIPDAGVLVPFLHHAISGHNSRRRQVVIMFCIGELILICYQKSLHDLFQYLSHWYNNVLLLLQASA